MTGPARARFTCHTAVSGAGFTTGQRIVVDGGRSLGS